jgi:DNA helicase HerA-like ATPase
MSEPSIYVGLGESPRNLLLSKANRHGLIAGATGTGKTVTLQVLAEGFASAGVPCFLADVKGDLAGLSKPGAMNPKIQDRVEKIGFADLRFEGFPVIFWDLFGQEGHPVRATVSDMGPLLLARMLMLNEVQEGVLNIAFRVADENGLLLLDLKDLRAILAYVAEHSQELTREYGNVSEASVGAIQRQLLMLEDQGGDGFLGEPALRLQDLMRTTQDGKGYINILAANKLMQNPRLYATFLLWLLSELFEQLPEVGDLDKPKLVFFFDEAHLLFDEAPPPLISKVEQVVRLIRSKAVGIYFITQNPIDVPDKVLGQLGNRVQHALRAFTPRDQKAVQSCADTFRQNPNLKTAEVVTQLGVGEALTSLLQEDGTPSVVERTLVRPPSSRIGAIEPTDRATVIAASPVQGLYDQMVDRDSAYERLKARIEEAPELPSPSIPMPQMPRDEPMREAPRPRTTTSRSDSILVSMSKSVVRSMGSQLGRSIVRGILGGFSRRR